MKREKREFNNKSEHNKKSSTEEFNEAPIKNIRNAEEILNELMKGLRDRSEELGEKMVDYTVECEAPLTDILENDTHIIIRMDLPGVEKDDITVHLTGESVEVKAVFPGKGDPGHFIKRERNYGKTTRSIGLSKKIKEKESNSTFKNSVLTIELPKLVKDRYKIEIK